VNPGFCEKMKVTRVPAGGPSQTISGMRTTGFGIPALNIV